MILGLLLQLCLLLVLGTVIRAIPAPALEDIASYFEPGADAPAAEDDGCVPPFGADVSSSVSLDDDEPIWVPSPFEPEFDFIKIELKGEDVVPGTKVKLDPIINVQVPRIEESGSYSAKELVDYLNGSFCRLVHPEIPEVTVRIKRISSALGEGQEVDNSRAFCDPTVNTYSGYIDTEDGRSLFFYFFESRRSPAKDPVLMWTNGGPGGSSSLGMLMENGPCRILPDRTGPPSNGTEFFEYAWNQEANVLYIDHPVGVGYSYLRFGEQTVDSVRDSRDIYHFFRIFFAAFEHLSALPLHISGESYAGRYIPEIAREIVDQNQVVRRKARRTGNEPHPTSIINLESILIGNGVMKLSTFWADEWDTVCTSKTGEGPPLFDVQTCAALKEWVSLCTKWTKEPCEEEYSQSLCMAYGELCSAKLEFPTTGPVNLYDRHSTCDAGFEEGFCFFDPIWIAKYLDRDDVRTLLGAAPRSQTGEYSWGGNGVAERFHLSGDDYRFAESFDLHAMLLDRGIRVLIYVGKADLVCPYLHSLRAVDDIEYPYGRNLSKSLEDWYHDGKLAGETATGGNLTFASFIGAGHMVPYKVEHAKPAQYMVNQWLSGKPL